MATNAPSLIDQNKPHRNRYTRLQKSILIPLLLLLVAVSEATVLIEFKKLPPLTSFVLPLALLLPGLAALTVWRRTRKAQERGDISIDAADFCRTLIIGLVIPAYVSLGIFAAALTLTIVLLKS